MERDIRGTKRTLTGLNAAIDEATDTALKDALKQEFQNDSVILKRQEARMKEFCKQGRYLSDLLL